MTSLETPGNHASVFCIDGKSSPQPDKNVILNACLAFIQSLRSARDKFFIQEATMAGFDFKSLKVAREVIFRYCNPKDHYPAYQGPRKASDTEKAVDAFDGVFAKIKELDDQDKLPIFACASEELRLLPQSKMVSDGHGPCKVKFNHIEAEMKELKKTFHTFTALLTVPTNLVPTCVASLPADTGVTGNVYARPVVAVEIGSCPAATGNGTTQASAISNNVRERLNSVSKRRKLSAEAEDYSTCDEDTDQDTRDDGFQFQGTQRRKIARRLNNSINKSPAKIRNDGSYASQVSNGTRPQQNREIVWGKGKVNSTSKFKGVAQRVPQIFLSKCDPDAEESDVKEYIESEGIKGIKVQKISPISFIVTVQKVEDFQNLLTGAYVPEGITVRKYFPRRIFGDHERSSGNHNFNRGLNILNSLPDTIRESGNVAVQDSSDAMEITGSQQNTPNANSATTASTEDSLVGAATVTADAAPRTN